MAPFISLDLYRSIMEHVASHNDRYSLVRVSKAVYAETESFLYRSVTFKQNQPRRLLVFARLAQCHRIAAYVHALDLHDLRLEPSLLRHLAFVPQALRYTANLKALRLPNWWSHSYSDNPPLHASSLVPTTVSFSLRRFSCGRLPPTTITYIEEFLKGQVEIEDFGGQLLGYLPNDLLQNLKIVEIDSNFTHQLPLGIPFSISRLSLSWPLSGHVHPNFTSIGSLRVLSISTHVLDLYRQSFPNIQFLYLKAVPRSLVSDVVFLSNLQTMVSLRKLKMETQHPVYPPSFFYSLFDSCNCLKLVEMRQAFWQGLYSEPTADLWSRGSMTPKQIVWDADEWRIFQIL